MRLRIHIRNEFKVIAILAAMIALIAFAERKDTDLVINDVAIRLENIEDNHYLDEDDIVKLILLDRDNLAGARLTSVNLKTLENRIRVNRYVKDAQLFCDLKGDMTIRAVLQRPVARIVCDEGVDFYIADDGTIMPVSNRYTSRVILISGTMARTFTQLNNLHEAEDGGSLMMLIETIRKDPFWTAQIAQLDLDAEGSMLIYPQIGGQVIEFGKLEDVDAKLRKLKVFYREILPRMGWNHYDRVKLEYKGQIVAQ